MYTHSLFYLPRKRIRSYGVHQTRREKSKSFSEEVKSQGSMIMHFGEASISFVWIGQRW